MDITAVVGLDDEDASGRRKRRLDLRGGAGKGKDEEEAIEARGDVFGV